MVASVKTYSNLLLLDPSNYRKAVIIKGLLMKKFPIICIGGSAGGLDAYTRLLKNLPNDLNIAIVIVNHMKTLPTQLHKVLPHFTEMHVELVTEKLEIEPNKVFVIPSNRDLHVSSDEFRLKPISKPRGWPDVITVFLRSLIECWEGQLVAIIVSGYDCDGAAALCDFKKAGGITIAQDSSARHGSMPESAVETGCIDFILSPEEIAEKILEITK